MLLDIRSDHHCNLLADYAHWRMYHGIHTGTTDFQQTKCELNAQISVDVLRDCPYILFIDKQRHPHRKDHQMSYVIYNVAANDAIFSPTGYASEYATERAAKSAVTRFMKNPRFANVKLDLHVMEYSLYHLTMDKLVERINALTGEKFLEPLNTPFHCSPSSESYWSS